MAGVAPYAFVLLADTFELAAMTIRVVQFRRFVPNP